jgi:hypothetical protein
MRVTVQLAAAMAKLNGLPEPSRNLRRWTALNTRPVQDLARACAALAPGPVTAPGGGILYWRFSQMPLQPNLKEVIVAVTVMAATVVVSFLALTLLW